MKRHIVDEADARLSAYLPLPSDEAPPGVEMRPRHRLPETMVDTPLVRLYNFLRMSTPSVIIECGLSCIRNHVLIIPVGDFVVPSMTISPCWCKVKESIISSLGTTDALTGLGGLSKS
jgi:hypothetical protein